MLDSGVTVLNNVPLAQKLLTPECLNFVAMLQRKFNLTRKNLLSERLNLAKRFDNGLEMSYPAETEHVRNGDWKVAPVPKQLQKRWIEITGPPTRKGTINALNSGADMWMTDLEDSLAPTWMNQLVGQESLMLANKRTLQFTDGKKEYKLKENLAEMLVRPRGWHLTENNVIIDAEPVSASLFDFGVYFYLNFRTRIEKNMGGVFYYLAKLESYKEARLWNDVFVATQNYFNVPIGTIRATVLIETIGGGLDMEEILYELKDHIVGLNAGRWDYIFSIIKKQRNNPKAILPDRAQVTMTVPFMSAYTDRIVQVCHKRGAHAIGGMSAFIPSRTDKAINENAFKKIVEDKSVEVKKGFDGSWVAHPDLVKIARDVFDKHLNGKDHQKHVLRNDVTITGHRGRGHQQPHGGCGHR